MQTLSPDLIERLEIHARAPMHAAPAGVSSSDAAPSSPVSPAAATAAEPRLSESALAWPMRQEISLCVLGFDESERALLGRVVELSSQHGPRLTLVPPAAAHLADVVMVDGTHAPSRAWSHGQTWLARRAVVWVGTQAKLPWHASLPRPVQWPALPVVMLRSLERVPQASRAVAARPQQADAPMVMVLGEDRDTQLRIRRRLETAGFRVTGVTRAREGLAALHAADYAAVVVASDLPDAGPVEVCQRVRGLGARLGRLPLVWLTERSGAVDRLRARWAGCDAVTPEPAGRRAWQALLRPLVAGADRPVAAQPPLAQAA